MSIMSYERYMTKLKVLLVVIPVILGAAEVIVYGTAVRFAE